MFKTIFILVCLWQNLFSIEIKENQDFFNLLPKAKIYIDKHQTLTFEEVKEKHFSTNDQKSLGFGYSPTFTVWIKFTLENNSSKVINKILEYGNPLTTDITFFDAQKTPIKEGLTHALSTRKSVNPIFPIVLKPKSSRTFYIKASSHITTLIVKLHLWNEEEFYAKEIKHQVILSLFFGAMGIIILYNFLIYLGTKEVSYLYYVLFFIGMMLHHSIYTGIINIYFLSSFSMNNLLAVSFFVVSFPTFFLALFVNRILEVREYPKLNKMLILILYIFPIIVLSINFMELYNYRNIFSILLLSFLFFIVVYAFIKKSRQASFLITGWFFLITSGLFMYLSSIGILDTLTPYYTEFALIMESLIFSLSLADKIKHLHNEKVSLQKSLLTQQKKEKDKLSTMVKEKTEALNVSLEEKELLLKELNHRVKNSIQTIVSFLRLQSDELKEEKSQKVLRNIENRILSISHLYELLYTHENLSFINTYEYFSLLVEDIESSYSMPEINISVKAKSNIPSEYAVYCGFILNEAISNSLQHAFVNRDKGEIKVYLKEENGLCKLSFYDDGIGYKQQSRRESLGLVIIETLVIKQLKGRVRVNSNNGTKIEIEWKIDE